MNGLTPDIDKLVEDLWEGLWKQVREYLWLDELSESFEGIRAFIKVIFGVDVIDYLTKPSKIFNDDGRLHDLVIDQLASAIKKLALEDSLITVAEDVGMLFVDPILHALETVGLDKEKNVYDFARSFHGVTMILKLMEAFFKIPRGGIVGQFMGPIGELFENIPYNLGIGFMGWQTMSPILDAALTTRMVRDYNAKFLNEKAPLTTQIRYHVAHANDTKRLTEELAANGYDFTQRAMIMWDAFRPMSMTELVYLLEIGKIDEDRAVQELIRGGANPYFASILLDRARTKEYGVDKNASLGSVRKAFKEGLITEQEFRFFMDASDYTNAAIELEILLVEHDRDVEWRKLTLSQMKAAFMKNVITKEEIYIYLKGEKYADKDINYLFRTWEAEKKPPVLKITVGEVKSAFTNGVIDYNRAVEILITLTQNPERAKLILETELSRLKAVKPTLPISILMSAVAQQAISVQEFQTLILEKGLNKREVDILLSVAYYDPLQDITLDDIRQGFLYGAISTQRAIKEMQRIDVSPEAINLRIQTWEQQKNAQSFKLSPGYIALFYRQKLLTRDLALSMMINNGVTVTDANLVLNSVDTPLPRDLDDQHIENLYVNQVIDSAAAVQHLVRLGYDLVEANLIVKGWKPYTTAIATEPTVHELLVGLQKELLTVEKFTEKMLSKGYSEFAIEFYLALASEEVEEPTRQLTKSDILGLYEKELIGYGNALERLIKIGYSAEDAELLLRARAPKIQETEAHAHFVAGTITATDFLNILQIEGYTVEQIQSYLERYGV